MQPRMAWAPIWMVSDSMPSSAKIFSISASARLVLPPTRGLPLIIRTFMVCTSLRFWFAWVDRKTGAGLFLSEQVQPGQQAAQLFFVKGQILGNGQAGKGGGCLGGVQDFGQLGQGHPAAAAAVPHQRRVGEIGGMKLGGVQYVDVEVDQ